MSENLQDLEEELQRMRPRSLSPEAKMRIAEKMQLPQRVPLFLARTTWWWVASAAGVAAALMLVTIAAWNSGHSELPLPEPIVVAAVDPVVPVETVEEKAPRRFVVAAVIRDPVSIESVLVSEQHASPVLVSNNVPLQPVRRHYVDRARWFDPSDGTSYSVSVPREDTVLVGLDVN